MTTEHERNPSTTHPALQISNVVIPDELKKTKTIVI